MTICSNLQTKRRRQTRVGVLCFLGLCRPQFWRILILIPLIYTEALPKAMLSTLLIAPPPPPPPPPPPAAVKTIVKPVARLIQSGKLMQPRAIPKEVAVFKEAELPPDVINNAGATGGVFGGIPGQGMVSGPVAPPPPKPTAPQRVKQGGNVTAASILTQTRPLYPPLARQARIQGNVVLHAIIDKDGKGCPARSDFRSPPAGAVRSGCREAVALQADAAERRSGRSRYDDYSHIYDGWLGFCGTAAWGTVFIDLFSMKSAN